MSNAYVIEIDDVAVGVVVRQGEADGGRRYCFYAANAPFRSIEGKLFRTPDKARKAAITLMGKIRKGAGPEAVARQQGGGDSTRARSYRPSPLTKSTGGAANVFLSGRESLASIQ